VSHDGPTHREPAEGSGLGGLFAEVGNTAAVTVRPFDTPGIGKGWEVSIRLARVWTEQAAEEMPSAMARSMTRALAEDGVTYYGSPITVEVDRR
jgi:hypothetical protein